MRYITLLLIMIPCFWINAESRDSSSVYSPSSFEKFVERMTYSSKAKNKNIIGISYGISNLSYPDPYVFSELAYVFLFDLNYGFLRLDEDYQNSGFLYLASETFNLTNYSSHMAFEELQGNGKTSDGWQFGFSFTNGYGYTHKFGKTIFIHTGGLGWLRIDFENPGESLAEQNKFNIFDEHYKFGSNYNSGLRHYLIDGLSFDAVYQHSIYFPKFLGWEFLGSFTTELLIQRAIDYYGEDYIHEYPSAFPILNWSIKNMVSLFFYELRRKQMNFPFDNTEPLNYDSFKLGVSLTF